METSLMVYDYPTSPEYKENINQERIDVLNDYIDTLEKIHCEEEMWLYEEEIQEIAKDIFKSNEKLNFEDIEDLIEEIDYELNRYGED